MNPLIILFRLLGLFFLFIAILISISRKDIFMVVIFIVLFIGIIIYFIRKGRS